MGKLHYYGMENFGIRNLLHFKEDFKEHLNYFVKGICNLLSASKRIKELELGSHGCVFV